MSFTNDLLSKLDTFDRINTGTFYPELRKIKLLVLDTNGSNIVTYTYTSSVAGYFASILAELQKLFPNMFIYYTLGSSSQVSIFTSILYNLDTSSITDAVYSINTLFVSNKAINNGQLVFSYTKTGGITPETALNNLPLTFLNNAFTLVNSSVSIDTATSTATITISTFYTADASGDYGLSFSGKPFFTISNGVTNINIITLTNIPLSKAGSQFDGLTSLTIVLGQNPVIRSGTSLASCFSGCTNFNSNIGAWNTANVNNMSNMFLNATAFSADTITNWTITGITEAAKFCSFVGQLVFSFTTKTSTPSSTPPYTFTPNIYNYIQPLTTSEGNFTSSSHTITAGGSPVNSGNLLEGTTYIYTFNTTYVMNNAGTFGLKFSLDNINWLNANTTGLNITKLFNIPLHNSGNQFSTGSIGFTIPLNITIGQNPIIRPFTSLSNCFAYCNKFNSKISSWNTIRATSMLNTFFGASNFNNGGTITESSGIYTVFPGDPFIWNTSNVDNMFGTFRYTRFNCDIRTWNTSKVTIMTYMFEDARFFNQPISYDAINNYWNTFIVTNINEMFRNALTFNNGDDPGGTSKPLNWKFTSIPTFTNWRAGSGLSNSNATLFIGTSPIPNT